MKNILHDFMYSFLQNQLICISPVSCPLKLPNFGRSILSLPFTYEGLTSKCHINWSSRRHENIWYQQNKTTVHFYMF